MTRTPPENLQQALGDMLRSPLKTLVPPWSWKAALLSAAVRATTFFLSNLSSGRWEATKAMLVEAVFAILAGGLIGAISQQLRRAKPLWATALLVWAILPGAMLLIQLVVHKAVGTPHLGTGLLVSFCFAAVCSAFSWYAMRQGAMLGGTDQTTIRHDFRAFPSIMIGFLLVVPKAVMTWRRSSG